MPNYFAGYDPNAMVAANPGKRIGQLAADEEMLGRRGLLAMIAGGGFAPGERDTLMQQAARQTGTQGNLQAALLGERLSATPGARGSAFADAQYSALARGQQDALQDYLANITAAGAQRQMAALGELFASEQGYNQRRSTEKMAKQQAISSGLGSLFSSAGEAGGAAIMKSGRKFKKDIRPADTRNLLDAVESLNVKNFKYKNPSDGPGEQVGLIAEESPEMIKAGDQHLDLVKIVGMLLGAVQELAKERNGEMYG